MDTASQKVNGLGEVCRKEINGATYRVLFNPEQKTYTVYKDSSGNEELIQNYMNSHELAHCLLKIANDEVIAAYKMASE